MDEDVGGSLLTAQTAVIASAAKQSRNLSTKIVWIASPLCSSQRRRRCRHPASNFKWRDFRLGGFRDGGNDFSPGVRFRQKPPALGQVFQPNGNVSRRRH